MVLNTSTASVWWQCACGNCWKNSVKNRVAGKGCAVCLAKEKAENLRKTPRADLTGKRFGRLVVVSYAETQKESLWNCQCDCGNQVVVMQGNLTSGKTTSCGCKQREVREKNFKSNIHFVDGTCVEKIAAKTTSKNNTTGFRGVSRRANGMFRVNITFKGKRYALGNYATIEEAIEARLAGEVMVDEFLKQYRSTQGEG